MYNVVSSDYFLPIINPSYQGYWLIDMLKYFFIRFGLTEFISYFFKAQVSAVHIQRKVQISLKMRI
jgi:hypothetical protein